MRNVDARPQPWIWWTDEGMDRWRDRQMDGQMEEWMRAKYCLTDCKM